MLAVTTKEVPKMKMQTVTLLMTALVVGFLPGLGYADSKGTDHEGADWMPAIISVGDEEVCGSYQGSRPTIATDSLNQPHIFIDKGWGPDLYVYHKISGAWSEAQFASASLWNSERAYLPHVEIDAQDRAWISAWVIRANDMPACGQAVWLVNNVVTAPSTAWAQKFQIGASGWSNGNLSLDPAYPNECVVMTRDGDWAKVSSTGTATSSGRMFIGQSGEKLRFLIHPQGVWHGAQSG